MKVVVCDSLTVYGGAERVLKPVLQSHPGAEPGDGLAVARRDKLFSSLSSNSKSRRRRAASVRLFNRRRSRANPLHLIHGEIECPGRSIPLPGMLPHRCSYRLAEQLHRHLTHVRRPGSRADGAGARAGTLKLLAWSVPCFLWVYVARGHWRMGEAGPVVAIMTAHAEFLRWATSWEHQTAKHLADPPEHLVYGCATSLEAARPAGSVAHQHQG